MAEKSRDAFRTISEVAEWLDVPTHVLRFWESRFSQIKPVKRAGGRRYYRPSDMRVIGGVKVLLHDQGMTIRGVQKLFREEGIKHVSGFSPALFDGTEDDTASAALDEAALERAARPSLAARTTRDATPTAAAPAETAETAPQDAPGEVPESVPMFQRAPREAPAAEPTTAEAESVSGDTAEPAAPPAPSPAPTIPATPDVPEIDVADDDAAHAQGPGLAARLRQVPQPHLAAQKAALEAAATRLRALLDRNG